MRHLPKHLMIAASHIQHGDWCRLPQEIFDDLFLVQEVGAARAYAGAEGGIVGIATIPELPIVKELVVFRHRTVSC